MSCYHPLYMEPVLDPRTLKPVLTANGKTKYRMIGSNVDDSRIVSDDSLVAVPCGKCIGCRLDYSRRWADRLMLELQYHDSAYFVTLTYNDTFVPRSVYAVSDDTGECRESFSLSKRDVQLFMKRLRKAFPDDKIRFYCGGEYGPTTMRPHYHAILFGLHLDDLVVIGKSELGFNYYSSEKLLRCWSQKVDVEEQEEILSPYIPMGFVTICDVSWNTCAYVARYVTKKLSGPMKEFYDDFSLVPPFSLMSRKPGIARQYYDEHPELFDSKYINLRTPDGGRKILPPKYFEKLLGEDNPDLASQRSEVRAAAARAAVRAKLENTTLSYGELLEAAEDIKQKRTKSLIRRDM